MAGLDKKISQLNPITGDIVISNDLFVGVDVSEGDTVSFTKLVLMSQPGPIGGTSQDTGDFTTGTFTSLVLGNTINEFSTDELLSGDSDDAVPTEKAVKFYSDRIPLLTSEPTGFPNRTDSIISMGGNTFSIFPTGVTFSYYIEGVKYDVDALKFISLSSDQGLHFIFFDGAVLSESLIFDLDILKTKAYVAVVYWDTTANIHLYMGDERHGLVMDWATHAYLHETRGTVWNSGLALI